MEKHLLTSDEFWPPHIKVWTIRDEAVAETYRTAMPRTATGVSDAGSALSTYRHNGRPAPTIPRRPLQTGEILVGRAYPVWRGQTQAGRPHSKRVPLSAITCRNRWLLTGYVPRALDFVARPDTIEGVPSPNDDATGPLISGAHPFLPPEDARSPVRRLRGRMTTPVTLWTAGAGQRPAGLPVASTLVIDGDPPYLLGAVDEETELWDQAESSGRFVVQILRWEHRTIADAFAGMMPAPGGPFRLGAWTSTSWGPVLNSVDTWAGCRLVGHRELGWSLVVEAEIEHVVVGDEVDPLLYRRGRYLTLVSDQTPPA